MRAIRSITLATLLGAGLAGCTTSTEVSPVAAAPSEAVASLVDGSNVGKGTATVTLSGGQLRLVVDAVGLAPGAHGLHVHTTGQCTPPDFASAGPHWNPTGAVHGAQAPGGPHGGDLPNLIAGTDGRGRVEATIGTGSMSALLDSDGAAVVLHANADDYRTDPSGNSGGRIACGVLVAR